MKSHLNRFLCSCGFNFAEVEGQPTVVAEDGCKTPVSAQELAQDDWTLHTKCCLGSWFNSLKRKSATFCPWAETESIGVEICPLFIKLPNNLP